MIQKAPVDKEMASEEDYVFNEQEGGEIDGMLEVFIRMNLDMEKDYCFNVHVKDRFRDLYKIFDTLPVLLNPSIFYYPRPISFSISKNPGYLTRSGALLFSYDADKPEFVVPVDNEDIISDKVWPGQLILPQWQMNYNRLFQFVSVLLLWLYTDLPDFISPTPGICLTNQISRVFSYFAENFLQNLDLAADIMKEVNSEFSILAQLGFFALHIFKTSIIFAVFYLGIFNPYKFEVNLFKKKVQQDVSKEQLIEIGWTSAKKATIDEFREFYHNYRIEKAGGLVKANRAGLFKELRRTGVELKKGEGFDTKLPVDEEDKGVNSITLAKMRKMDEFKLNYDYIATVGEHFEKFLLESKDPGEDIKKFRRYGPLDLPEELKEIVLERIDNDLSFKILK